MQSVQYPVQSRIQFSSVCSPVQYAVSSVQWSVQCNAVITVSLTLTLTLTLHWHWHWTDHWTEHWTAYWTGLDTELDCMTVSLNTDMYTEQHELMTMTWRPENASATVKITNVRQHDVVSAVQLFSIQWCSHTVQWSSPVQYWTLTLTLTLTLNWYWTDHWTDHWIGLHYWTDCITEYCITELHHDIQVDI